MSDKPLRRSKGSNDFIAKLRRLGRKTIGGSEGYQERGLKQARKMGKITAYQVKYNHTNKKA